MYNADADRERREYFRFNNRCTKCGKRDNRTKSGNAYCEKCAEKRRVYMENYRSQKKVRKNEID